MKHHASRAFWVAYGKLPVHIRVVADKNFALLKTDPHHPSLRLKHVGPYVSVRVGRHYRALAKSVDVGLVWFWIGHHADYDLLLKRSSSR